MTDDLSDALILDCECSSAEHIIRFSLYDWDTDFPELLVEVQASHFLPWYKRLIVSIKYLFGIPGLDWHDSMIKSKDVPRLKELIEKFEKCQTRVKDKNG